MEETGLEMTRGGGTKAAGAFRVVETSASDVWLVAGFRRAEDLVWEGSGGFEWAAERLATRDLAVVHERIFGSLSVETASRGWRDAAFRAKGISPAGPITYIEGLPPWGEGLAGWIIHAVRRSAVRAEPRILTDGGVPVGRAWSMGGGRFATLQGLHGGASPDRPDSRPCQVHRTIEAANRVLREQDFKYSEVLRTWFYLAGILGWYGEFNEARTQTYCDLGLCLGTGDGPARAPASTGIGGRASHGRACTLDLLAVSPGELSNTKVRLLRSAVQPEPLSYGSSFSRGAVVELSDFSLIQVSGTAAIDETGGSVFPGDVQSQIRHTLDSVGRLLAPEGAFLADIVAATAFVKRPGDADAFFAELARRDLMEMPVVCVVADICREELLFELEAEVAVSRCGGETRAQSAPTA